MRIHVDGTRYAGMRITTSVILTAITLTLIGCSTPRYQMLYRYEPPADASGRNCLVLCNQNLESCQRNCAEAYSACVQANEPEAKTRYADAVNRYQGQWDQYQRDLDRYHLSLYMGWGHYDDWYGGGWYEPWPYGGYRPYYFPPQPPQPPSYADELAKMSAERCDHDCGCQPVYDACFLGCGGRKVPERRCIVNCPPDS